MNVSSAKTRKGRPELPIDLAIGLPFGMAMIIGSFNGGASFKPAPSAGALR